ncbi:MAG: 2-succinyl-5-enolpyruvyl-6-hydroxy-3-cyclohexene-1-carboxylic-acid synthase, partial [Chloroflexota bacterium]
LAAAAGEPLPDRSNSAWVCSWREIATQTRLAVAERLQQETEFFEGRVFAELAGLLPAGAMLVAGNSMPVRDLDMFFPASERSLRFLANRGANG